MIRSVPRFFCLRIHIFPNWLDPKHRINLIKTSFDGSIICNPGCDVKKPWIYILLYNTQALGTPWKSTTPFFFSVADPDYGLWFFKVFFPSLRIRIVIFLKTGSGSGLWFFWKLDPDPDCDFVKAGSGSGLRFFLRWIRIRIVIFFTAWSGSGLQFFLRRIRIRIVIFLRPGSGSWSGLWF